MGREAVIICCAPARTRGSCVAAGSTDPAMTAAAATASARTMDLASGRRRRCTAGRSAAAGAGCRPPGRTTDPRRWPRDRPRRTCRWSAGGSRARNYAGRVDVAMPAVALAGRGRRDAHCAEVAQVGQIAVRRLPESAVLLEEVALGVGAEIVEEAGRAAAQCVDERVIPYPAG